MINMLNDYVRVAWPVLAVCAIAYITFMYSVFKQYVREVR